VLERRVYGCLREMRVAVARGKNARLAGSRWWRMATAAWEGIAVGKKG